MKAPVTREYGKPCLVGIENATQRIADGQMVEVDGAAGTLTIVSGVTGQSFSAARRLQSSPR